MAHAHPEGGGGQQPVTFDDFQNFMDSLSGGSSGGQPGVSGGTASFPGSFIGVSPSPFGGPAARRESSRVMLENAGQFGERQAATLDPILKTLMQALGFGVVEAVSLVVVRVGQIYLIPDLHRLKRNGNVENSV